MKCAMELTTIAEVKARENEIKEILRIAKEKEDTRIRTIQYCEELGKELEKLAENGKRPVIVFECNVYGTVLISTNRQYADRRTSYKACGVTLDLNVLTDWFEQYCFQAETHDFIYWSYGWGKCKGYRVVITPQPICK